MREAGPKPAERTRPRRDSMGLRLLPFREVARIYRERHPGEQMSRALAYYTCKRALRKLKEAAHA
jgi:hypothetical protein